MPICAWVGDRLWRPSGAVPHANPASAGVHVNTPDQQLIVHRAEIPVGEKAGIIRRETRRPGCLHPSLRRSGSSREVEVRHSAQLDPAIAVETRAQARHTVESRRQAGRARQRAVVSPDTVVRVVLVESIVREEAGCILYRRLVGRQRRGKR